MKRFVKDKQGNRIEHTGIKVWYVMCGTQGKKVEWAWLVGPVSPARLDVVCPNGARGCAGVDDAFFTKQAAIDNWRYHSKAEDREHLKLIKIIAEGMIKSAEEAETKLRPTKPWQEL